MRENRGLDTEMVLEHIEELVSQGVQGLAIAPNTAGIRQCIDELYEQGIPVITFNSMPAAGVCVHRTTTAPDSPCQA